MKMSNPHLSLGVLIAILAFATLAIPGCGLIPDDTEAATFDLPEPPKISQAATYPVTRETIMEVIEGTVQVAPIREVTLYFEVGGRIQMVDVEPRDTVSQGDVLARLEIDDLEHSLALTRLDLQIAEAGIKRTEAQGAAPLDLQIQTLSLEKQRLAVRYLEAKVAAGTITAPFDGVIQRVQIRVSELIREYDPVIVLSDPAELEMQMPIDQDEFYRIDTNMEAEVETSPDVWTPVRIIQTTHINPRLDASANREEFVVHFAFKDGEERPLRLNDRTVGRIILQRRDDALVIPSAALREFGDRDYVRVSDDGVRREVDVRIGIHTGTHIEIVAGLEEGELVIGK